MALAAGCFVLALCWATLWWLEADRGLLSPWFPGFFSAPAWTIVGALWLRKARRLRRAQDEGGG